MGWRFLLRVVIKAAVLFIVANLVFALLDPVEALGRVSLYNVVMLGRERLPYGENPSESYNLSLYSVPAMFASHVVSRPKRADEYRVLLIGDSSTWGWLLENRDAYAANINAASLTAADGRRIVAYNLGYPIMSLTKDLMLLDDAMQYQPDQIVWLVTLASFPRDKQLFPPIVQNNAARVRDLIARYDLQLDPDDSRFVTPDFFGKTIIGQRRALADCCACKPTACRGRRRGSIRQSPLSTPRAARILTPICRGNRSLSRRHSPATISPSTCWRRASSG